MTGRKFFRKGFGELVGFAVSSTLLIFLLILVIGFSLKHNMRGRIDDASILIGRDIATCESIDEAREKAEQEAELILGDSPSLPQDSIETFVEYSPGSDAEWAKGNYVVLFITGDIHTIDPITSGVYESQSLIMIERDEGSGLP